jgi:hypothetical protein
MLCHSCRCHVTPTPPRTIWKVVNVGFWIASLIVATGFSLLLGLNLILAPAAIVVGMAVGTSARRLSSWTCPHCGAELVEPEPEEEPLPPPAAARPLAPATSPT